MAHELEIGTNGQASFASLRQPAWHGLGTVFEHEVTTHEMLKLAKLDQWNVRLEEIAMPDGFVNDKTNFFVARNNPFITGQTDVLGVVGERYHTLQNEELFSFADAMLDGGGRWETAGSIKGGRQVFGSIALEREAVIDSEGVGDVVKTYLLVNTSHDGSVSIQASITPVRVVCANTLNMAIGRRGAGVKQTFKIRHTQTAGGKVQAAREALGLVNTYMDEFDKMANDLYQVEINNDQFHDIIRAAYPTPDEDAKGAMTRWTGKVDTLEEIYNGPTTNMISGTAWGAFNSLTERLDWFRNGRGGSNESILAAASGFDAAINAEKNRLLKVVKSVVMA